MKRDYIEFRDRSVAIGFLITFRCYGTWLHGDKRGSVDRRYYNKFGTPKINPSIESVERKAGQMKQNKFNLGPNGRRITEVAIKKVCRTRGYKLIAINVRSNHVHLVVSNSETPERMMSSFKAYATRALRASNLLSGNGKAWSRHGSTRYLWTDDQLHAAVDYVLYGQGDELPKFD